MVVLYCGINATLSAGLIAFNKYLMHKDRFPYPLPLVAMHTSASSIFVGLFFLVHRGFYKTTFFSALPQAIAEPTIKFKAAALAGLFAVQLVFSNAAYLYSSVVFTQMMKEGNLPIVYFLSVAVALEAMHWQRVQLMLIIVFATLMTIKGELDFVWIGFVIQLTGQGFESVRIVLQAIVLNAKGLNLDVLTYMLFVMPACAFILLNVIAVNASVFQVHAISLPTWPVIFNVWPLLLANTVIAVTLNFTTALVVKHASAIGLVMSGIIKDSAVLVIGAHVLGESISGTQLIAFVVQISGVALYSLVKLYPERFSDGILVGLKRGVGIEADAPSQANACIAPPALNSEKAQKHCYGSARMIAG